MVIYQNTTKKLNWYTEVAMVQRATQGEMCSMDKVQPGVFRITSVALKAQELLGLESFVEVFYKNGNAADCGNMCQSKGGPAGWHKP